MQRKVVLFREGSNTEAFAAEAASIREHFALVEDVSDLGSDDVVVPRFSLRPFASDIEAEIAGKHAALLNTVEETEWVSNLRNWSPAFSDLTPETFWDIAAVHGNGPWIVKGDVNALRDRWATHCFAADPTALRRTIANLEKEPLLKSQKLCIRDFVPLRSVGSRGDMPLGEEYRVWFLNARPYFMTEYWSGVKYPPNHFPPDAFLGEVSSRIPIPWAVFDVAYTADGRWIVIEGNDPANSGLGRADPQEYYASFAAALDN